MCSILGINMSVDPGCGLGNTPGGGGGGGALTMEGGTVMCRPQDPFFRPHFLATETRFFKSFPSSRDHTSVFFSFLKIMHFKTNNRFVAKFQLLS